MIDRSLACALAFQQFSSPHAGVSRAGLCPSFVPTPVCRRTTATTSITTMFLSNEKRKNNSLDSLEDSKDKKEEEIQFLRDELDRVESLEEIVDELDEFALDEFEDGDDDDDTMIWSEEALSEIFGGITDDDDDDDDEFEDDDGNFGFDDEEDMDYEDEFEAEDDMEENYLQVRSANDFRQMEERIRMSAAADLERALLQGVVPVSAGVGSECLPGDYGFDPLGLADKDYFRQAQGFLLNLLPGDDGSWKGKDSIPRPKALILRDLREAEVRHGRLAMLAAVFWPLQEMLDRLLLDPDQAGSILYGPVTLPYFPLLMTAIMLLLGYSDIYAKEIKEVESIGEAYLPGDCFFDPLRILQDAPDTMKRNMQEREILNGRVAMLAVAAFTWEEAITHLPLIEIGQNDLLLEPAYEVPFIQQWLDSQFSAIDPESAFLTPAEFDSPQTLKVLLEEAVNAE